MSGWGRARVVMASAAVLGAATGWLISLDDTDLAWRLGGAAVGALVAMLLLRLAPGTAPPGERPAPDAFEAVWRRQADPSEAPPPAERERLGTLVRMSLGAAGDAHRRLRPLLRELADARLDAAYGTHVDGDPRAAERLGPDAWELVRPDRPEPADPLAAGPSPAQLDAAVAALERLGDPDAPTPAPHDSEGS